MSRKGKASVETWRSGYTLIDVAMIIIGGVAIAVPGSRRWLPDAVAGHEGDAYIALATVAATLLGFVIAAITILVTVGGRKLVRTYKSSGLYGKTLGLFHVTATWLAVATFVALAGLLIDQAPDGSQIASWRTRWIWVAVISAVVAGWRLVWSLSILKDVMDLVAEDQRDVGPSQSHPDPGDVRAPLP